MGIIMDGRRFRINPEEDTAVIQHQEFLDTDEGSHIIRDSTELGDSLKELNNDDIEAGTRMSGIDMRSRLHYMEISSILAVDSLVSFKFLPVSCLAFTRQKKRLSVSLNAEGRNDIVKVVSGKRELDTKVGGGGFIEKARSWFSSPQA